MPTTDEPAGARPTTRTPDPAEFPPMIEYPALAGLPVPVRLVLATAALPLEVAVTSVRLLKDVEALVAELVVQLRGLRPAVTSLGQAYADDRVARVLDTIDDVRRHGGRAAAVARAPVDGIRYVLAPARTVRAPVTHEVIVEEPEPDPEPRDGFLTALLRPFLGSDDPRS